MQPDPAGPVGVLQREGQRRIARARTQHHVANAAADQFVETTRACVVEGFTSTECHSRTVWPGRAQALTLAKNFSIAVLTASGRSKNPR